MSVVDISKQTYEKMRRGRRLKVKKSANGYRVGWWTGNSPSLAKGDYAAFGTEIEDTVERLIEYIVYYPEDGKR